MPGVDELGEEHSAILADRQVADLVDDEQGRMGQHTQPSGELACGLGIGERLDQSGQRAVVDAAAGFGGRDGLADGQMSLADSRRPQEDHVLAATQEPQLVQALDLLALDARLEGEVELRQGLLWRIN